MKTIQHSWGQEYVLGSQARVVRVYATPKRLTIDLSQVRDKGWEAFKAVQRKHGSTTKIVLPSGTDPKPILDWWASQI